MKQVHKLDAAVADAARPLQGTKIEAVLSWVATLGDQPQLRALSIGTIVIALIRDDRRLARAGVRMLLAHELATAIKTQIKNRIDRRRPRSLGSDASAIEPRLGNDRSKEESSFPSGHAGGSAAVARAFMRSYPQHRIAAGSAAGIAALVQIPRCAHYPTDIGAGITVGFAAEAITAVLLDR